MSTIQGTIEIKAITLDDWDCFGEGATASSYYHKQDDGIMLKLFALGVPAEEAFQEKHFTDGLIQAQLSVPAAYDVVEYEGRYGVIYQRVKDKVSFSRALANNPEELAQLATLFAQECKKLHQTPCDTSFFPSKKQWYKDVVARSEYIDDEQRAKLQEFLDGVGEKPTCLHGDLHIGNLILAGEEQKPYWIDLAAFGYGDPFFDMGLLYYVLMVGHNEEACMLLYHNKPQTLVEFWEHFLPVYVGTNDEAVLAEFTQTCRRFATVVLLFMMEMAAKTGVLNTYAKGMFGTLAELLEQF